MMQFHAFLRICTASLIHTTEKSTGSLSITIALDQLIINYGSRLSRVVGEGGFVVFRFDDLDLLL